MKAWALAALPVLTVIMAQGAGELKFDHVLRDVKVAPEEVLINVSFPFTNVSGRDVRLGKIESNCDCTTASYGSGQKILPPGASGVVTASMTTGTFSGTVEKQLTVHAAGGKYPLTIKATIPEVVKISPRKLEWKVGEALEPKTITVTIDPSIKLKLTNVSLKGENFDYEPVTVRAGREYQVVVTPKNTARPVFNSIWILTDSSIPRYSRFLGLLAISAKK